MKDFVDYYEVLGVYKSATSDEITKAFRKLSRKYHPDISSEENAEEIFKRITEAYEVLNNVEKRHDYDLNYEYLKSKKEKNNQSSYHSYNSEAGNYKDNNSGASKFEGNDSKNKDSYRKSDSQNSDGAKNYTKNDINKLKILKIKKQVVISINRCKRLIKDYTLFINCSEKYDVVSESINYIIAFDKLNEYLRKLIKVVKKNNLKNEFTALSRQIDENNFTLNKVKEGLIENCVKSMLNYIYLANTLINKTVKSNDYEKYKKDIDDLVKKMQYLENVIEYDLKELWPNDYQDTFENFKNVLNTLRDVPLRNKKLCSLRDADMLIHECDEYVNRCIKNSRSYEEYLDGISEINLKLLKMIDYLRNIRDEFTADNLKEREEINDKILILEKISLTLKVSSSRYKFMNLFYQSFVKKYDDELDDLYEEFQILNKKYNAFLKNANEEYSRKCLLVESEYNKRKSTAKIDYEKRKEELYVRYINMKNYVSEQLQKITDYLDDYYGKITEITDQIKDKEESLTLKYNRLYNEYWEDNRDMILDDVQTKRNNLNLKYVRFEKRCEYIKYFYNLICEKYKNMYYEACNAYYDFTYKSFISEIEMNKQVALSKAKNEYDNAIGPINKKYLELSTKVRKITEKKDYVKDVQKKLKL